MKIYSKCCAKQSREEAVGDDSKPDIYQGCEQEVKSSEKGNLNESELEVYEWLNEDVKLSQYFDLFIEDGFDDMTQILTMTDEDLSNIGIENTGYRRKILVFI